MKPKKMAILAATPEVIRHLLQLPEGVIIDNIRSSFNHPGVLEIRIEGAGWDVYEGAAIAHAQVGTIEKKEDGSEIIDWKLPIEDKP